MSRRLLLILSLLAVIFAGLTVLAVRNGILAPQRAAEQSVAIGGPFLLTDQNGRSVDQGVLKGKWSVVFFGYTFCPDACPTTMFALGQAQKLLGPKAAAFQTVFITVDPARDTPRQLAAFLSTDAFPRGVVGLTGTPQQVDQAAKAYHVYYQKAGTGAAYTVDHSTMSYLMNPGGGFACVIPYDATPQQIAVKVEAAMAQGASAESC
jgi:protein SCO1/2